ncbi:tRNA (cytidine(34)-2'-O)-methyltransferase [Hyphobacterium sp. HN65]|uniref:tRNA (cytidine(34)-2'-O)-methyltransferase n=1 Tax=Hyphobacterium lacteum TaxID=3116575 RepID=A0ABU7LRB6_9PROT|nr:tRNA (cytidine(34)-2'-O)-methyltransferase [Hyphobacterium sp. HN65]MEE2526457.1 tRNA (cytidine(34)-2'-O)-methyltransferase [Hyphobacterium sp. HN65]
MRLVFFQPDIPQNLGASIRLAACFGAGIDVIEPCAFPLNDKAMRRAALDYAPLADFRRHDSYARWQADRGPGRMVLFTTQGATNLWNFSFEPDDQLVFGRESAGVPETVHGDAEARVFIPIRREARSLNVSMSAGIALAEAMRQLS